MNQMNKESLSKGSDNTNKRIQRIHFIVGLVMAFLQKDDMTSWKYWAERTGHRSFIVSCDTASWSIWVDSEDGKLRISCKFSAATTGFLSVAYSDKSGVSGENAKRVYKTLDPLLEAICREFPEAIEEWEWLHEASLEEL